MDFPRSLTSYGDGELSSLGAVLAHRITEEPFNLVATIIFVLAIVHTLTASRFTALSHRLEVRHRTAVDRGLAAQGSVSASAELFHFLGEVEVVFGLWAIVLGVAMVAVHGADATVAYIDQINFTEPIFVVVIMALAATRPILQLAERMMGAVAGLLGDSLRAWWLTILTVGPLLGSFITEPAAMTICALLLGSKVYQLEPRSRLKYATLGLLFVNISVGGTLTHFAAPPIVMVAHAWHWDLSFTLASFGWKSLIGIVLANALYLWLFRSELARLEERHRQVQVKRRLQADYVPSVEVEDAVSVSVDVAEAELKFMDTVAERNSALKQQMRNEVMAAAAHEGVEAAVVDEAVEQRFAVLTRRALARALPGLLPPEQRPKILDPSWNDREDRVPLWMMVIHVGFLIWTVAVAHHPPLFLGGLLFFLGFARVSHQFQNRLDLKRALLVGFFLAGLLVHGGLQGWWIEPVLRSLPQAAVMLGATVLTAFNDNAAITYLATLVPDFGATLRYAVVAGAVAGGGLTIIANAPNPAGQSILGRYFADGVSAAKLLVAAALPTAIVWLLLALLPSI